jgi:hypothetical protein
VTVNGAESGIDRFRQIILSNYFSRWFIYLLGSSNLVLAILEPVARTNYMNDQNDKITSDTYDRGIIPAETAARMKREGKHYKHLPKEEDLASASTDDQTNVYSIRTTDGYTVDQEGLVNNYPVEPEMYYEVPGDAREIAAQEKAERIQELREINEDKTGLLTEEFDKRGRGPGII